MSSTEGDEEFHAVAPPILEMRNIAKRFGATQALEDVSLDAPRRRDPCAPRRERRRQVDPDQDHDRRPPAGSRRDPALRQADHHRQRRRGAAPRHRRDLPGAAALPRPQRRGEHLHQPPGPRPRRRLAADVSRGRGDPGRARRRARCAQPGPRPDARRPAVGRDRQGDLAQRPRPDHGRADRVALGP